MASRGQEQISQPTYKIKVEKDVHFKMRDGVRISADIYRPDAEGKFPALLALSPYGKEQQCIIIPPQTFDSPLWDGMVEAGNTDYIVPRGYAHVVADIRGTGDSEGEYVGLFCKEEGPDGYDLVESIAKQPWCDGNVGMIGMSYFGMTQLQAAAERPPHLKAICPFQTSADLYRFAYDGGILHGFMIAMLGVNIGTSGIARRRIASAMIKDLPKAELDRRVQEAKNNLDLKNYSYLYSIVTNPERHPLLFDLLINPTEGPYYWERSPYTKVDRIEIPTYVGVGLGATQIYILGRTFDIYDGVKGPKKLLLTETANPERPFHQWHDDFMRWFDYWLKGIDTGIMDEPPIKRFVTGANKWSYDTEWPLARTKWTKFYLRTKGRISLEPETIPDVSPNCFVQEPLTVTKEIKSLKYATPPLSEDTEVAGPVALYLYASIDRDDTNWLVGLYDENLDGSQVTLTRGHLKASHRALDEGKSKPWRPHHPHTKADPVVPGQVYEYAIEIQPVSHVFKAGHRIKLEIASMDSPLTGGFHFSFHVGSNKVTLHNIYCDQKHPSHLLLPLIPKT